MMRCWLPALVRDPCPGAAGINFIHPPHPPPQPIHPSSNTLPFHGHITSHHMGTHSYSRAIMQVYFGAQSDLNTSVGSIYTLRKATYLCMIGELEVVTCVYLFVRSASNIRSALPNVSAASAAPLVITRVPLQARASRWRAISQCAAAAMRGARTRGS